MDKEKIYKNVELVNENFEHAALPPIRNDFIAKLENALMFMTYKDLNMWTSEATNMINLKNFDGAWLVGSSLRHNENDDFVFQPYGDLQVSPDMFPNMNLRYMSMEGGVGHLSKWRFLPMAEKRHLERYRYIASHRVAFLDYGKQRWWMDEKGYGFNGLQKIKETNLVVPVRTPLKNGYYFQKQDIVKDMSSDIYLEEVKSINMALQLALTYYYEWSCYIKETPESLGVRVPIHPSSSKEVFVMRNVPEGKKRKRAIVNFVKEHYRTIKGCNDNERKILIQKHLRGDLKFNWRGLEVRVTPSPYDLSRINTKKKFPRKLTQV